MRLLHRRLICWAMPGVIMSSRGLSWFSTKFYTAFLVESLFPSSQSSDNRKPYRSTNSARKFRGSRQREGTRESEGERAKGERERTNLLEERFKPISECEETTNQRWRGNGAPQVTGREASVERRHHHYNVTRGCQGFRGTRRKPNRAPAVTDRRESGANDGLWPKPTGHPHRINQLK